MTKKPYLCIIIALFGSYMNRKIVYILRLLLGTLFLSYYASTVFFSHTHQIDGQTIHHSHPYLPSAQHSHSSASFHLIESLSHLLFVGGTFYLLFFSTLLNRRFKITTKVFNTVSFSPHSPLRGPPVY